MNLTKLNDKIFLFTAETNKELTLSFFRMQEYYESPKPELFRQKFSTFDFLVASMEESGVINYFDYWTGFNVPGEIVNEWWHKQDIDHITPYEQRMFAQLVEAGIDYSQPFYLIGALENDRDVIDHEIAHALYYTNTDFQTEMNKLTHELTENHHEQYSLIVEGLYDMGYCSDVIVDEIQAYLSAEKKRYLVKEFSVDYAEIAHLIKKYRKVLQKYNTFEV